MVPRVRVKTNTGVLTLVSLPLWSNLEHSPLPASLLPGAWVLLLFSLHLIIVGLDGTLGLSEFVCLISHVTSKYGLITYVIPM